MAILSPIHYDIHIIPDLDDFTFHGELKLYVRKSEKITDMTINSLELDIKSILLEDDEKKVLKYDYSLEDQELTIQLPATIENEFMIAISYKGAINDKLAGLYRSKYKANGEEKFCAVTQFQETDARRAFPCFDEPGKKATFQVSFTLEEDLVAISNTSIEEEKLIDGKKFVVFEKTPPMSTYLVFFAFGDFEWIEDSYRNIPIRLVTSPGKAEKYGELGLDYGVKSLRYCEDYFNIQYPLSKMDFIATPDFAAGAMENWGAILFRENALLYYPGVTSKNNEMRIKEIIAHEVAHQWFGNLVSPASWKYVWLNESFATFFAYGAVDHYEPELRVWDFFVKNETNVALDADAFIDSVPIEMEGEKNVSYTMKTIPILYNKGGTILRQVKAYLGDEDYKKGLQHYLETYEYDVARSDHLWESLQKISGKPITKMMEGWVLQHGYPVIHVTRKNNMIEVKQERFTYLPNNEELTWFVPLIMELLYDDGRSETKIELLTEEKASYVIPDDVYTIKINNNHTGLYRVMYDDDEWDKLGLMIENNRLSPIDRWNLENDFYGFLRADLVELDDYLSFLDYFTDEDNHLPIGSISSHLNSLYNLFDEDMKDKIADVGIKFLENVLDRIGYTASEEEHHTITMIRGELIQNATKFGSKKAREFAMGLFENLKAGTQIDANIYSNILQIAARETNDYKWFQKKFDEAQTEVENIYYGNAICHFSDEELIEKVQMFIFENIPPRNRGTAINNFSKNDAAKSSIWEWYLANLDNFEKLHPFIYQTALTSIITASVDKEDEVREFFKSYVKKHPDSKDAIDTGLENLKIKALLKNKYE